MEHSTGWSNMRGSFVGLCQGRVIGVPELGRGTNFQSPKFSRIQIPNVAYGLCYWTIISVPSADSLVQSLFASSR